MITQCRQFNPAGSLLVFSDDWGRHPSSCQHLVRNLLDRYSVLWVNTIGTRAPRLDLQTLKRVTEKLHQWGGRLCSGVQKADMSEMSAFLECPLTQTHPQFSVINPKMWPWFGSNWDRRFNCWLLSKQLTPMIRQLPKPVIGLTTLPITADLPAVLPVDRWVYYCVDDFSQWPGLDGSALRRMDRDMIQRADSLVAVSEKLQSMIANEGRTASLLTHGVDVDFWNGIEHSASPALPAASPQNTCAGFPGPRIVFWGVIDRRMDALSLQQLSRELTTGTIILVGPQQDPDPAILSLPNVRILAPQPLSALPKIAAVADVLIMPYSDLPVTRAMQPLKLKEYLATGRPVVVNRLPSTDAWSDCLDVAETAEHFSQLVRERIVTGLQPSQRTARRRLLQESWRSKAEVLENVLTSNRRD